MLRRLWIFLLILVFLCPMASGEEWIVEDDEDTVFPDRQAQARVLMSRMTLEEKVWQLLMVTPETLTGDRAAVQADKSNGLKSRPAGGVVIFGQNIVSEDQLKALTEGLQRQADEAGVYPLFVAVSEEGGAWSRVANKLGYPMAASPAEAAKTAGGGAAYAAGQKIGAYLKPLGINLDLAPVSDVMTADDAWIKPRVYGSSAGAVSMMALKMAEGLRSQGIVPCFSHFPGQGSINGNLNNREVTNTRTLAEMKKVDWYPFQQAIAAGAEMIMVSHAPSRAAGDKLPSSLSPVVIGQWLRGELGYQGVVITDSLRMGAITSSFKPGAAAVAALQAGADILMLPANPDAAVKAILKAIDSGEITVARIDESVARILALKIESGIIQ